MRRYRTSHLIMLGLLVLITIIGVAAYTIGGL